MSLLKKIFIGLVVVIAALGLFYWWLTMPQKAQLPLADVEGTDPVLAKPDPQTFPTIGVAKPIGWAADAAPEAAPGLAVNRFAQGLAHPRIMYTLPDGDVLVTLTNSPPRDGGGNGGFSIQGFIAGLLFARAGADVASPNQLVLLRDADGDGVAEQRVVLRDGLDSPGGIAWADGKLYIGDTDAVLRFDYALGDTKVTGQPVKLMDLPGGGNHWMRNVILTPDATRLYVTVGSSSNIAENGIDAERNRAAIHEINLDTGKSRIYGAGLRNPNGLAWNPWTGELWTTVNERDQLGSDLVPDYMTNVPVGVNYGWPWVYYKNVVDERVDASMPNFLTDYTRMPEYALGPHVAALGLVFTQEGAKMGAGFGPGAYIARHGSWNRAPASGYDVVFVSFDARGQPHGQAQAGARQLLGGRRRYPWPTHLAHLGQDGRAAGQRRHGGHHLAHHRPQRRRCAGDRAECRQIAARRSAS